MSKLLHRLLLLTLLGPAPLLARAAQQPIQPGSPDTLVVPGLGNNAAPLDGPWQFHLGDDLAWASPTFNDSAWEQLSAGQTWGAQTHFNYTGFAWYRRHIDFAPVPGADPHLALFVPPIDDIYEIYWNGAPVGHVGKFPPHTVSYSDPPAHTFGLGAIRSGVLAIRVYKRPYGSFEPGNGGGFNAPPIAGSPAAIAGLITASDYRFLHSRAYRLALVLLYALVSVLSLLAWLRNRNLRLLFWMSIFAIFPLAVFFFLGFKLPIPFSIAMSIFQPLDSIGDISTWFLLLYLLQLDGNPRLAGWTRILAIVSFVGASLDGLLTVPDWGGPHVAAFQLGDAVLTAAYTLTKIFPLVLVFLALKSTIRLNAARWLVALFAFLSYMLVCVRIVASQGLRFTHWTFAQQLDNTLFTINNNPFTLQTLFDTGLFLSIVYAVYRYTVEQGQRQSAIEQEFRSAQELQRVLIPETLPQFPGYAITSAYRPAQQVGGDFFQVIAKPSGAALMILGDVSGKGLKAAMTVSLLIGAVRTLTGIYDDPADILAGLNDRLNGRLHNGFVTCLVLRLESDGLCTFANAGHLAPFLNATELILPPELPLGLVPSASYETTTVHLAVDDRLTLYTDGLLEARSPTGELYGFDRVQTLLATRPDASAATAAAVSFGQDDDITVLTLTRLPLGVESTTSLHAPELVPAAA
jgi:hypothetical protein